VDGFWEIFRDHWLHVGGTVAIKEWKLYPPGSYFLDTTGFDAKNQMEHNCSLVPGVPDHICPQSGAGEGSDGKPPCMGCTHSTGELCGQAFWVKLNQRLHMWRPESEEYPAEIERVLYNGVISQIPPDGTHIRQFALLHKKKMMADNNGTCCEGQGTRILGSLPEYLVSFDLGRRAVYVNLYADSMASLAPLLLENGTALNMTTAFPADGRVDITYISQSAAARSFVVKLRMPSWVAATHVNVTVVGAAGHHETFVGTPKTYLAIDRRWSPGDRISFTLIMALHATRYTGLTVIAGHERYAVEYGPILLAAVGGFWDDALNSMLIPGVSQPLSPTMWLRPGAQPLQFVLASDPRWQWVPYYSVQEELFEVYPCFTPPASQQELQKQQV